MEGLLTSMILSQAFMDKHQNIHFRFGGPLPTLYLGGLKTVKMSSPERTRKRNKIDDKVCIKIGPLPNSLFKDTPWNSRAESLTTLNFLWSVLKCGI